MNKSKNLAIYIAKSIIQAVQSTEFNRANWRANTGDILMEISDGNSDLVLSIEWRNIDPKKPVINDAHIRFGDDEFQLSERECKILNLSESLINSLKNYCSEFIWKTTQTV